MSFNRTEVPLSLQSTNGTPQQYQSAEDQRETLSSKTRNGFGQQYEPKKFRGRSSSVDSTNNIANTYFPQGVNSSPQVNGIPVVTPPRQGPQVRHNDGQAGYSRYPTRWGNRFFAYPFNATATPIGGSTVEFSAPRRSCPRGIATLLKITIIATAIFLLFSIVAR